MGSGKKAIDKGPLLQKSKHTAKYDEPKQNPVLEDDKEKPIKSVPFLKLFRYAATFDYFLLVIAILSALVHGAAWPCMIIVLGDTVQAFVDQAKFENFLDKIPDVLSSLGVTKHYVYTHLDEFLPYCPNVSALTNGTLNCGLFDLDETVFDQMKDQAIKYSVLGAIAFVTSLGQLFLFIWTAERQILRMRLEFYKNVLKQEMAWFDTHSPGALTVKITDDIGQIHDAIGDKTGTAIQWFASFVTGAVICFYYGWELALVMLSSGPALCIAFAVVAYVFATMTAKERVAYANAGTVAEEVFSSIRTVAAFGGQEKESRRYAKCLEKAKEYGVKKSKISGIGQGVSWAIIYGCFGIGFYYGGRLVRHGDYKEKDMIVVFMTSLIACLSLGLSTPALSTIKAGCGAAYSVFDILDKKSEIDSSSTKGLRPSSLSGQITFKNVHFCYPSRRQVTVLDGFDLTVMPGQTVALVGTSGCGKSTTIQLLLRFYDVISGKVMIDGLDVRDLNLKWLRQRIGLVRQEPVLFPTTIAENIRYGREGVSMERIIQATKDANAYDFIMKLPEAFETHVGERGAQLSGGQKQRIAIARALISDPKILLLDEATSALDTASEAVVQDALEKASKGRSTIVIAHRLSTVRNADIIVAISGGKVVEKGTHDELMVRRGAYYELVSAQMKKRSDTLTDDDELSLSDDGSINNSSDAVKIESLERSKSIDEETDESLKGNKYVNKGTLLRLLKINKGEWLHLASGGVASLTNGGLQPAWGLVLAYCLDAFTKDDKEDQKDLMNLLSIYAVGIGFLSFFAFFFQEYSFGISGEALTAKMRELSFRAMIRQETSWFDDVQHQTGALGSQLAVEASLVQGAVKTVLGSSVLGLGNLGTATVIGFIHSWRLSLLALAFTPFVVATGLLNVRYLGGAANDQKNAMEEASKSSMAGVDNISTVAALAREDTFYQEFRHNLSKPYKNNTKSSVVSSVTYAITQSTYFFTFAACFYYGSRLMKEDKVDKTDVFKVFNCIILGSVQLGQSLSFVPNTSKALQAAGRIFKLSDVAPKIDPYASSGIKPAEGSFKSSIRFSSTHFRYPMRRDVQVLSDFEITVNPGQMLALVGESGCGKSTIVQLLQRFYDTESGGVFLDKYNLKDLNVQWLRSQIGMVSQEPILFDASIAENIAYGDNTREVQMDEIIAAARSANIHNFIQVLPNGYETNVGSKGTQLSGGQKQRVAIARALVRNPKILLLDEATSALDTESEKIVQDALDRARQGRTCITIAHRLSTIKNADVIAVLKAGKVTEKGTHSQLMALKSHYYQLQTAQSG